MYDAIVYYYELGYYNNENMKIFVEAEWITPEQYKGITGVEYVK